jgi:hypothetical protein
MRRPSARWAIAFAAVAIVATLEQILFGRDTPGLAHDVSVGFWAVSLIAGLLFVGIAIRGLVRFATVRKR